MPENIPDQENNYFILHEKNIYSRSGIFSVIKQISLKINPIRNKKMKSIKELGEIVRRERKKMGVTQADLAMSAGTGLRFVVDLERGKPTVQAGKMLDVIQALGLRLDIRSRSEDL
jgi:HTH-type transcriptional regulator/antitoxin HipB